MSDEIRLIDKIRAETLTYKGYSLSHNPFPETGKAPQHPLFCAGRTAILNRIGDFVADIYTHESVSGMVVLGVIGGGKTHVLRYMGDKINNELREAPLGRALAVYIENPQTGVLHIYTEFMSGVGITTYTAAVWKIVYSAFSEQIKSQKLTWDQLRPDIRTAKLLPKEYVFSESLDEIKNPEFLREQIANGKLSKEKIEKQFIKYLEPYILDKDVLACSVKLLLEDNPFLLNEAWRFICGLRVIKETQRALRLLKPSLDSKDINKFVFKSVINILREAGYKAIFLLLDEVETLVSLGTRTRFAILDELRSFFDSIPSNFGLILACTPPDWQQIINTYPAIRDRIKHVVELKYMSPEETVEVVRAYLNSARIAEAPDSLYPFTEDAITEICRLKRGIVRYIVEACHILLKEGARQNFPKIEKDFVSRYVRPLEETMLE